MGLYCSFLMLSTSLNFLHAINMPNAYVRHKPDASCANRVLYKGSQCVKTIEQASTKSLLLWPYGTLFNFPLWTNVAVIGKKDDE